MTTHIADLPQLPGNLMLSYELICQQPWLLVVFVAFAAMAVVVKHLLDDGYARDNKGTVLPGLGRDHYVPIIGHGLVLANARKNHEATAVGSKLLQQYGGGSILALRLLTQDAVILGHPDLIRTILTGNYKKFPKQKQYSRMQDLLGDGLVTGSGESWRFHRHVINPAFHAEALHHMVTTFNKHTRALVAKWQQDVQGKAQLTTIPSESIVGLTFDIMAEAGFGFESNTKLNEDSVVRDAFNVILEETNIRLADPFAWQQYLPWRYFPVKKNQRIIRGLLNEVLDQRVQEKEEKYQSGEQHGADTETSYARDLLDVVLDGFWDQVKAGNRHLVYEHAATFLTAGHETTAGTLQWVLYELACHPEIQQKCREEIQSIVGHQTDVLHEQFSQLKYLQQVLKESLRVHPPIPRVNRQTAEPIELGKYQLAKDAVVVISIFSAHHHPDFWESPYTFDPDRWSPERMSSTIKHPFQYIPFSAGPRNCIGQRFAQFESLVVLSHILRSFEVRINPTCEGKVYANETVTTRPGGLVLDLVPLANGN